MYGNVFGNALKLWQRVTLWPIHVLEFEKLPYPLVISISVILNVLPHITIFYKHG